MCKCGQKKIFPLVLGVLTGISLIAITVKPLLAVETTVAQESTNNAEILGIVNTINSNEINAAKEAAKKQIRVEVKNYAALMLKEHQMNLEQTLQLAKKQNIVLDQNNTTIKELRDEGATEMAQLIKLNGEEFSQEYMKQMVQDHTKALDKIDELLKEAQHPDIKNHLTATRAHVAMHLEQAKEIHSALKS